MYWATSREVRVSDTRQTVLEVKGANRYRDWAGRVSGQDVEIGFVLNGLCGRELITTVTHAAGVALTSFNLPIVLPGQTLIIEARSTGAGSQTVVVELAAELMRSADV